MSDRLTEIKKIARRDDWRTKLVGSDIRKLIAEVERLEEIELDAKIRLDYRMQRIEQLEAETRAILSLADSSGGVETYFFNAGIEAAAKIARGHSYCHPRDLLPSIIADAILADAKK